MIRGNIRKRKHTEDRTAADNIRRQQRATPDVHSNPVPSSNQARPYRSHKYPACARCHKRRSRCAIERPGEACLLCRLSNVKCSAELTMPPSNTLRVGFSHKSRKAHAEMEDFSQVLGPVLSRDTHVLESIILDAGSTVSSPTHGESQQNGDIPVYRSANISRRPSPPSHRTAHDIGMELFQQVDPYIHQLLTLYFDEIHPCLPVLDEQSMLARVGQRNKSDVLLLSNFIAYAMFYWELSPKLPPSAKPNQDFAWDAAVAAMNESSQRGNILAITSALLNIAGRPSMGGIHNTGNVARSTALAHSLGLNHDCHGWNLSQSEKDVRIKLWWAVVVHDRWFNFAQGTPPYINKQYYNVPLPTIEMLTLYQKNSEKHLQAAQCYIGLCQLTEIVGDVLPLIYHVRSGNEGLAAKVLEQTEINLSTWLDQCPRWITSKNYTNRLPVPGLLNLQLSYLALRMLLKRLAWHESIQHPQTTDNSWLTECLVAAEDVVQFVQSLRPRDLAGFWLPYNVNHFISAVTLLLRCALQAKDQGLQERSISAARQLVNHLRLYYETSQWDMAEIALPQTEPILRRIELALLKQTRRRKSVVESSIMHKPTIEFGNAVDLGGSAITSETSMFHEQDALEDLFPELFAEFTDGAFWDQAFDGADRD